MCFKYLLIKYTLSLKIVQTAANKKITILKKTSQHQTLEMNVNQILDLKRILNKC